MEAGGAQEVPSTVAQPLMVGVLKVQQLDATHAPSAMQPAARQLLALLHVPLVWPAPVAMAEIRKMPAWLRERQLAAWLLTADLLGMQLAQWHVLLLDLHQMVGLLEAAWLLGAQQPELMGSPGWRPLWKHAAMMASDRLGAAAHGPVAGP